MSILDSISRSIKNVFVGSHRGEDFILENLEKTNGKKKMENNTNDLGVDPNEWFGPSVGEHLPENGDPPSWYDTAPSEYEPSDFADLDWFRTDPKPKEETMHEKMYKMATAKYNPFAVGGSESLGGGSEEAQK